MRHSYPFAKGHGTENDFVLLPDPDGSVHGSLSTGRVRALCDRRAGIGADGVLRVVRSSAIAADLPDPDLAGESTWFMDYRNADGSVAEMCGNGIRVFVHHLLASGLVEHPDRPVAVGTRAGVKLVTRERDGLLSADLGRPQVLGETEVGVGDRTWPARHADLGNPHAVAFVDDLTEAGPLLSPPAFDTDIFGDGVNIEFVVRRGPAHLAMRVHERGSGETRSCGTGAAAVMAVAAVADGLATAAGPAEEVTYRVDVPGGRLRLTWTEDGRALLAGPAAIVAEGTTGL